MRALQVDRFQRRRDLAVVDGLRIAGAKVSAQACPTEHAHHML